MRHQRFLPSRLTVGEARDLGPCLIRVGLLVPIRDGTTDIVFQGRALHTPVEEQRPEVLAAEQVKVELVDSSGAEVEVVEDEMVVRWNMTADWFLPNGRPAVQQQQPQNREQPLLPPLCATAKGLTIPSRLREGLKRLLQGLLQLPPQLSW